MSARDESPESCVERVRAAEVLLKTALQHLERAGCPKSAKRVRLAISSVRGALANADYRLSAAGRGEVRKRVRRAPEIEIKVKKAGG